MKTKKIKKLDTKEQTMSDASGSFESPIKSNLIKRKISKGEFKEETGSSVSAAGQYDAPIGGGRKDPLSISKNPKKDFWKSPVMKKSNFPKFGGPGGVYVGIKEKCQKFPYCNQGDINNIEILSEAIKSVAKKRGLPIKLVEKIVLKELNRIFI